LNALSSLEVGVVQAQVLMVLVAHKQQLAVVVLVVLVAEELLV
jgi:hypothetical protein